MNDDGVDDGFYGVLPGSGFFSRIAAAAEGPAGETPYQRTARLQRERQAARAARLVAERRARKPRRARQPAHRESYEDRLDDLGDSPDY